MYAVATFLIVAVITTAFSQITTGSLIATGLPPDIAAFQARSALSGSGFTTTEAENVVNHPTRRKIISTAMFAGSLGTPTLVVTVLLGLVAPGPGNTTERALVTGAGLLAVVMLVGNRPMKRLLKRVGQRYAQERLLPALGSQPQELLSLGDEFSVGSIRVTVDPEGAARSLRAIEEVLPWAKVLGVRRGTEFFGETPLDISLQEGDELVVYARRDRLVSASTDSA